MKYKEFKKWCNDRAHDGCWSIKQAKFCIDVMQYINAHYFWQREKVWKEEYEYLTYLQVIKPINDKLQILESQV